MLTSLTARIVLWLAILVSVAIATCAISSWAVLAARSAIAACGGSGMPCPAGSEAAVRATRLLDVSLFASFIGTAVSVLVGALAAFLLSRRIAGPVTRVIDCLRHGAARAPGTEED